MCIALAGLCFTACDDDEGTEAGNALTVKVFAPTKVIPGQEVVISGTGLDRVESVVFPGGVKAAVSSVTGSGEISVITPEGIDPNGGELTLESEGESVTARLPMTVGSPAVSVLSPSDEITAGEELSIVGKDLEFFSEIIFPGKDGDISVKALDFNRKATDRIRVTVPEGVEESTASLTLLSKGGLRIQTPEISLKDKLKGQWVEVEKTAWTGEFDLNGWANNFYLLASWFPGIQPGSKITIHFKVYNGWGQFKLNLGDWGKYNWNEIPDENDGGMMVKSDMFPDGADATQWSFTLPEDVYDPWFSNPPKKDRALIINGERFILTGISYTVQEWEDFDKPAEKKDMVWEGSIGPLDWSENGKLWLNADQRALFTPGKVLGIDFECPPGAADGYYVRIMGGWWTKLPSAIADFNNTEWERHEFGADETSYEITLTQEDIDILNQQESILFCGSGIVLKDVYLK